MPVTILPSLMQLVANRNTSLRWYHSVGVAMNKIAPRNRGPAARAMRQIAREAFGDIRILSTLYTCRRFASIYSERELSQLDGVKWKQLQYLISVKDRRLRNRLIRLVKMKRLSPRELVLEIQENLGKRTNGGRKPRLLRLSPKASYRESTRLCNELVRCIPNLLRNAGDMQTDQSDSERESLIAATRESFQAATRVLHDGLLMFQRRPR